MKRSVPRPTPAELEILRILWSRGPSTVREVQEALGAEDTGYTTALKLMQIMADKGLLARDETARAHVYSAQVGEGDTLYVTDAPGGVMLTPVDPTLEEQLRVGREVMRRYRNVLRELAK